MGLQPTHMGIRLVIIPSVWQVNPFGQVQSGSQNPQPISPPRPVQVLVEGSQTMGKVQTLGSEEQSCPPPGWAQVPLMHSKPAGQALGSAAQLGGALQKPSRHNWLPEQSAAPRHWMQQLLMQ